MMEPTKRARSAPSSRRSPTERDPLARNRDPAREGRRSRRSRWSCGTNCKGAGMRTRIAVIIGTCLVAQLVLASTPASAGGRIRAREVVGGLNQPVAFTFGPGRKVWYVEKGTGRVRIHDLDTDADRLFVKVPGVNGDGERGMLGIALHPSYPAKPLVYVYATRSAGGRLQQPDPAVSGRPRFGRQPDGAVHERRGRQPVPQRRADRVRPRRHALRDRRRRPRLLERARHERRGPRQDHPHRPRRPRPERQPLRRPRVGVRDPELVRLRVRSADRRPVGDRERAVVQRRDQPDPGRRELRLGAERDLQRRFPRQHEPGRTEPDPARAVLPEHDRHHRRRVLRRLPPRQAERRARRSSER